MTPEQFCYWLQGYTELNGQQPTQEQWEAIKSHLQTVFVKVTEPIDMTKLFDKDKLPMIMPGPIMC